MSKRVALQRLAERHALLPDADGEAAEDVDDGDDDAGDRVAVHELGRTVHRPVEVGFPLDVACAALRASFSLMSPALRSASIAICLPGIASSVKRAATSATRPAPLVMTMNWMTKRMRKMTRPTT